MIASCPKLTPLIDGQTATLARKIAEAAGIINGCREALGLKD